MMAQHWMLVIFQGILTSIAKKPYIFVIFQAGPDPLSPPPSWIRTCRSLPLLISLELSEQEHEDGSDSIHHNYLH